MAALLLIVLLYYAVFIGIVCICLRFVLVACLTGYGGLVLSVWYCFGCLGCFTGSWVVCGGWLFCDCCICLILFSLCCCWLFVNGWLLLLPVTLVVVLIVVWCYLIDICFLVWFLLYFVFIVLLVWYPNSVVVFCSG